MTKINLGDKVKDPITGLVGIAVGRTVWIHGCARITIQPQGLTKEGKPFDSMSADEPQLVLVAAKKVKEGNHSTGGPRPEVYQKASVRK